MENNKFKKVIGTKRIGDIEYRLIHLINDNLFIIYKKVDTKTKLIQEFSEIFQTQDEQKAKEYLDKLK